MDIVIGLQDTDGNDIDITSPEFAANFPFSAEALDRIAASDDIHNAVSALMIAVLRLEGRLSTMTEKISTM